jgi:hypothetical protein
VVAGLVAIVIVIYVGVKYLPGPVKQTEVDNTSGAIGAAIGAGVGAIATIVSAFFGIRAAGEATQAANQTAQQTSTKAQQTHEQLQSQNERLQIANERTQVTLNEVAGAAPKDAVQEGLDRAASKMQEFNLVE